MQALCAGFVLAADEVWRLQNGADPECRFFQGMAEQGHYGGRPGRTRQGIYVVSPDGTLLGSVNSNDAARVGELLRTSLAKWQALPEPRPALPKDHPVRPDRRHEDRYPEDGLALRVITRDLGSLDDPAVERGPWNRDFCWFSAEEQKGWIPPAGAEPGTRYAVPALRRLAKLNLVDCARGQVVPFHDTEVREAGLEAEVVGPATGGVQLRLRGTALCVSARAWPIEAGDWQARDGAWPRGVRTWLEGTAVVDPATGALAELTLVARGWRWGRSRFNGRARMVEPTPIGFLITLAGDTPAERVAPTFFPHQYDWPK